MENITATRPVLQKELSLFSCSSSVRPVITILCKDAPVSLIRERQGKSYSEQRPRARRRKMVLEGWFGPEQDCEKGKEGLRVRLE